ncbi:MAG: hypothetical protein Q9218_003582 [Villophora microphyllina]
MASETDVAKDTPESIKPSFPGFVVALFLAKSKPTGITVREYLANLRSFIRNGQRPKTGPNGPRYIDSLAFWKDSHQRLQNELNEQRARIFALEQELDASRGTDSQAVDQPLVRKEAQAIVSSSRGKKRKRGIADGTDIKAETQYGSTVRPLGTDRLDHSLLRTHEAGLPDAVYALYRSLSTSSCDPSTIASILRFVLSEFRRSAIPIDSSPNNSSKYTHPLQPRLAERPNEAMANGGGLFDATTMLVIFPRLLAAMERIGSTPIGSKFQRQLIYDVVELLRDLLDHVCHLAVTDAKGNQVRKALPPKRRSTRGKKQTTSPAPRLTPDDNIMKICRLIIYALQTMRKERQADQAIVEGFTFFLLRRIGEVLRSFVFGEEDEGWKGVWAGQDVGDLQWTSFSDEQTRQEKRTGKEAQAPYLIWLLERSMDCFASNTIAADKRRTSSRSMMGSPMRAMQGVLPEQVKVQLQNTILKEVVGQDLPEFKNSLNGLQNPGVNIEPWAETLRSDVVDSFKADVWRLIGWDCLKSSIEWDMSDCQVVDRSKPA